MLGSDVALDLALYAQHVAIHRVPLLWRVHRAHHADPGFDATTGVRFHSAVIVGLCAPAIAELLFVLAQRRGAVHSHQRMGCP